MQNQNAYGKFSESSMPVTEVEEWLNEFEHKRVENKENNGIIKSTTSIIFIDNARYNATAADKKPAIARGRRDFNRAMKNIAKQDAIDAKAIKKKTAAWAKELRVKAKPKPKNKAKGRQVVSTLRRQAMVAKLLAGENVPCKKLKLDGRTEYNQQRHDVRIAINEGLSIIRLRSIGTGLAHYTMDKLPRYTVNNLLTGSLIQDDTSDMILALNSKQMVSTDNFKVKLKFVSTSMSSLSKDGMDIYTVLSFGGGVIGWVVL